MKIIYLLIVPAFFLILAGCSGAESAEATMITDSLKKVNATYLSQLEQKDQQLKAIEEKSARMAGLQDTVYILSEKLRKIKLSQGYTNPDKQNAALKKKEKDNAKEIEELSNALNEKEKQARELDQQIKSMQSDMSLLENKAKEDELAKIKLENDLKKTQNGLSDLSPIQVSSVSVKFYRNGLGKSAKNIKMAEFCFLIGSDPMTVDGKKVIHACIYNPEGLLYTAKEDTFTTHRGDIINYTVASQIDYKKDLTIEDKCINWDIDGTKLTSGTYKVKFYIETKSAGEAEFIVP